MITDITSPSHADAGRRFAQPSARFCEAWRLMATARAMANWYENHRNVCSRYVHSTSRGHEAIQVAAALHLQPDDYAAPYYRDDAFLLGLGLTPYELMLQLLAKADDPFSGGRTYYAHPSLRRPGFPTIPHQSSATGMQAIPATGMAQGILYLTRQGLLHPDLRPVVVCSIGDGAMTEGEVSEALQMAVLKKLPILYLVQDNDWAISATGAEMHAMNAWEFAAGFKGLRRLQTDGVAFVQAYEAVGEAMAYVREQRAPLLLHARCPLLNHHTSGVRQEFYRPPDEVERLHQSDPVDHLSAYLTREGIATHEELDLWEDEINEMIALEFERALAAPDPDPATVRDYVFVPTSITAEQGQRHPEGAENVLMVDAALHAIDELLSEHPEALLYGQDVGKRLGGVFREAARLAEKHGEHRVFNTPIQEAYLVGSTVGMSAVGAKPIVEIQFADYIWPGMNQLVEELSKSCYLSQGQFPVQALIRIPIGAYGGGGPYHSGSIESTLLTIRGIKVVYPANAADLKGLMKAAFLDPNPVIMLEHKGLYWSKVPGTAAARTPEPDRHYVVPLGKARLVQEAAPHHGKQGTSAVIITYGMGVYWALAATASFEDRISIQDLRTLHPLDWEAVVNEVEKHNKVLLLTEEPLLNSFMESLAGRISRQCFRALDAPVFTLGAEALPAVPLNVVLERAMLPTPEKVGAALEELLAW
ncbi:thiamine pyrophosphate-dependent enzyme [Catalinimonas alkaloidigena]|uniref:alpha-ketoacid dehydrogenase subunit alpha/beta n=1 Tax=Catalinimonas alkaloidigena TaxID=1075417 RepID=UPI001FDFC513|nr:alpha-ketoacid dehydrogenase subunit alpha/beta [Catalinimonas alkaloidigena]